jgi:HK97 family phage portal protein
MGLLARAVAERKGVSVFDRWLELMAIGARSKAGPPVTRNTVFQVSAAFACMGAISRGLAQVPFKLMRETQVNGLRQISPARDLDLYHVLATKPNSWQTAFEFMETVGIHASLGNAYVFKNFYRGKIAELIPLNPGNVRCQQNDDWSTQYWVRGKSGAEVPIDPSLIWHIRGPSWDGFLGLDVLSLAREALGLSMALEETAASLHSNGVRPSGVYSVEGVLNEDQQKKLVAWLKREASGPGNVGNPMVLDRAAKWVSTAMSSVDAQHKEMRDQQVEEVCRFFGVIPTVIGFTGDKANTYASAEVAENAHKVRTMGPWYKRIQDSADVNLLTDDDRRKQGLYWKFAVNALMAASASERSNYYSKALGAGGSPAWMTQDEIRECEEMNPMGGDAAALPKPIAKPAPPANP